MSTNAGRCALYLRSSKDRHDVSIDAQRRSLVELAAAKGLTIVAEYSDAVEAANDFARPGFRDLLLQVSNRARGWGTLLAFDTSRLARDVHLAGVFRAECRRHEVRVAFVKIPDIDPLSDLIIGHIYQLLDHIHSHMSREKGLAGMAENVRRGYRAGGRAPYGYTLEEIATGAVRDGAPVTKSRLVPNADAPAIAAYLRKRAAGLPARQAARECGVRLGPSSLVDVEWRALTYAGHTVWNQTMSRGVAAFNPGDPMRSGGYQGGTKRRPRAQWLMRKGTHEALIDEATAEQLLERLTKKRQTRMRGDAYLLSGILVDRGGRRWHGDQGFYRCGRRRVKAATLERQILDAIAGDLMSDGMVKQLAERARAAARPGQREAELAALQRQAQDLERKIGRVRNVMTVMASPEAMAPKLDELVAEKKAIDARAAALVDQVTTGRVMQLITEEDVRAVLRGLVDSLATLERELVKSRLRGLLEKITVDPGDLSCKIYYAIPAATGVSVASPSGTASNPAFRIARPVRLYGFRRAA